MNKAYIQKKGFVSNSMLALLAFFSCFLSRCFSALKVPGIINLFHLVFVPFVFITVLIKTRSKNERQILITKEFSVALFILLIIVFSSALINDAGIINAIMGFLLLSEPFMMLITIISIPMTFERVRWFRSWIVWICLFHTYLAFFQNYVLRFNLLEGQEDNIQGIFYRSGAGHVVGASVALTFGIYFFLTDKSNYWIRLTVLLSTFWEMILADAKQVLLCFAIAGVLLIFVKVKDVQKLLNYVIAVVILGLIIFWCIENIEAFAAFKTWTRPEIYGPDGEAIRLKFATFRIIPEYFSSPLNWFFGLGPGHTVGRLGGWMIENYWSLIGPLGATKSPATSAVWSAVGASWLGDQSSLFSPLFGWAGIWGDYGPLGLAAYFYLSILTWRFVCYDDLSKYLMLSVFAFGLVFSQMEEPGYMLFIACLIALQWHEANFRYQGKRI